VHIGGALRWLGLEGFGAGLRRQMFAHNLKLPRLTPTSGNQVPPAMESGSELRGGAAMWMGTERIAANLLY